MAALPDPYPTRLLGTGTAGLPVSAIGLGCMGMSEFYGPGDDARSVRVIQVALGLGVVFFDTADMLVPVGSATGDRYADMGTVHV